MLYTVQVKSTCFNYFEPGKPLYWHFVVEAASEADAIAQVQSGDDCRGMPARVVPPLGMGAGDWALTERRAFDALDGAYRTGDRSAILAAAVAWKMAADERRVNGD